MTNGSFVAALPCARLAVSMLLALAAPVMAQETQEEMPEDVRGEWVADINPTTKDMFATDCPCESDNGAVEMTCAAKSGTVRIEFKDFLTDTAKAGDKAEVTLSVDGEGENRAAVMAAYTDGFVMPALSVPTDDPLFAALSAGRKLALSHGGKSAETRLKGSKKAMETMIAYCGK